ncbi:MAG: hypothetical protein Q8O55_06710 [Dehalococcoidales bacterium]|nr:hypothetical protein [Dehalococcoidales bacterium]
MLLDDTDQKLLSRLQTGLPLTGKPYAALGSELGIDQGQVIHRIEELKAKGIVRQISPVLDARKLGYQSTLVAMKVADKHLKEAERLIREHPGVSHGYERDHDFNIWVTLAIPPATEMAIALKQLTNSVKAEAAFTLPAVKLFKIRAYFAMDGEAQSEADTTASSQSPLPQEVELSAIDKAIINVLQEDLPLVSSPFTPLAEQTGMDLDDFLAGCQSLRQRGVMRRYAAAVNHRRAGFKANAMTCWVAPPERVDAVGRKLALLREVSHCYERRTNPLWRYNLFAMIHGHSRNVCQEIVDEISRETALMDYVLLYSTKEFKKTRIKYLV